MKQNLDIAVCGAGPAGLASALYLTRLGHRVRVFERFETPRPIGSGLILQPTGIAVLADLGLRPAILALGAPVMRLRGTDALSGRTVLDVGYGALHGGLRGLGVHRAALFSVLHEAVRASGIPVVTGTTVTGVADRVLVGQDGQRLGGFDLVVDGLGAGSPLKPLSRGPGSSRPLAFGALWATLPWVEAGFDRSGLRQRYRRADVMIGVLPIGRQMLGGPDLAAFFWSQRVADHDSLIEAGLAAWKHEVHALWPETAPHLDAIAGFEQMTLARYAHHTMAVPAGRGIAFVGDSAHSTSPQLGQGANMALLDARALFLALRDGADVEDALARYCRLRRTHVRLYQALSAAFTPFYQSDSRVLPAIRDLLVAKLARVPPAPQLLAAMVAGVMLNPIRRLELSAADSNQAEVV